MEFNIGDVVWFPGDSRGPRMSIIRTITSELAKVEYAHEIAPEKFERREIWVKQCYLIKEENEKIADRVRAYFKTNNKVDIES